MAHVIEEDHELVGIDAGVLGARAQEELRLAHHVLIEDMRIEPAPSEPWCSGPQPEAKKRGLSVRFDGRDLEPGAGWQAQLERVLERESTAFTVYVGGGGIINWVDSEVRVALSRARNEPDYPFIPILSKACSGSDSLPAFARQYQGVSDVEGTTTILEEPMSGLHRTPLTTSQKVELAARALAGQEVQSRMEQAAHAIGGIDDRDCAKLARYVRNRAPGVSLASAVENLYMQPVREP